MEPKYSILYIKENINNHYNTIKACLDQGIKVFWFGSENDRQILTTDFEPFAKAFFLQAFSLEELTGSDCLASQIIIDGEGITTDSIKRYHFDWLEENVPAFNAAQFRVEHCQADANIVVKASAGTGKTTVMVDRILYLMHMVQGLKMSEIYMITFTNEATNQMNDRLQQMLLKKYSLTKNKRYLNWLEQQSQMHISTIDSLAFDLFKKYGTDVGFGRDLTISPLERERKELIKDILSEQLDDSRPIDSQIGLAFSQAGRAIDFFWSEITRKGYTISEVLDRDWGDAKEEPLIENFQKIIQAVLAEFETRYSQLKLDENAISLNDLFFDFGHYILQERIHCDNLEMKYLFVDEFQDTDATQIFTFASLVKSIGASLFAVGDIKQSIYGFKGATDKAFDILEARMHGDLEYFSLRNNYRTCANIMKIMENYFFSWAGEGLLRYDESVRPFNQEKGSIEMEYITKKDYINEKTLDAINDALNDLEMQVLSGRKPITDKTKVAVLVRGNGKAAEIANLCRDAGKTVVLSSDRPFFLSQAVRDFYALICSYVFVDQPIHIYNYLMTPYCSYDGMLSVSEMELHQADKKALNQYLNQFCMNTSWYKYQREFRLRPVLAVIKEIMETENVLENFIAMDKARMQGKDWTEAKKNKQALIDAKSYRLNLDKLMEMLQQRMDGQFASLYDIYVYLSLMIATNREEMEPDIEMEADYSSVYIMTVHKSKGLEFDTVIMPAMNHGLEPNKKNSIYVTDKKIGWYYKKNMSEHLSNPYFEELFREASARTMNEETRLLYVAMTRAVNKIVMLVNDWDSYVSWSTLIRKVGLINE